ncbi:hypothetical protein PM082_022910 [Marasmius tenuissimus]|nr:hypothetical protein PM082_022910 [Marasmius tenuissimus]
MNPKIIHHRGYNYLTDKSILKQICTIFGGKDVDTTRQIRDFKLCLRSVLGFLLFRPFWVNMHGFGRSYICLKSSNHVKKTLGAVHGDVSPATLDIASPDCAMVVRRISGIEDL